MPRFNTKVPKFKRQKDIKAEWNNFKKGLNLILRETELDRSESPKLDNILLTGSGVPTGRWGQQKYFNANATGSIRGFATYISGSTNEIMALSDWGYLAKKDGASYSVVTGQSWPSGSIIRAEQLGGKTYIVCEDVTFTEYDGSGLSAYATISPPTGLSATNFSGATGPNRVSYKVVALSPHGGTTTASGNYVLADMPSDLTSTEVHLFWTAPSAASLSGHEIYRGREGEELWLAAIGPNQTSYWDKGAPTSETIPPPITNTTGGVKSKFIIKYKDRLLVVDKDDPNKLIISGRYPNHTKFNWADGGGYIYIDPDSGDDITGIAIQPISDRIVIYKNYSSYLVELKVISIGNYAVLDPQYLPISNQVGCSNHDTIQTVENDVFYFGRAGLYVTGYEPNFLNIIRTNEISARIRPYFEDLTITDYNTVNAAYFDKKYLLSFPAKKQMVVYDRERGCFAGIWKTPFGISHMKKYFDGSGTEKWVVGSYDSNQVYTFERSLNTDDGTAIIKTIRTNKDYFGDWTLLNIIKFFYILFRNISGTVTINVIVEDRSGASSTIKSFTISGAEVSGKTGWGMNKWGLVKWGLTGGTAIAVGEELKRWGSLFKQAAWLQTEITTSSVGSNFELLGIKITASKQSEGSLSSAAKI